MLRELIRSIEDEGVTGSASFLDFVRRTGLAEALARSTLRIVAVLAFEMVAEVRMPEETVAVLMKLSALSRRATGLAGRGSAGVPRELSGHRELLIPDVSMLLVGVEPRRGPCSRREETSCVGASAHLVDADGRPAMLLATSSIDCYGVLRIS